MAGNSEGLKAFFIPAVISLSLFLAINYLLLPAVRRYRERYEQYLPLYSISESLAERTSSLRQRAGNALVRFVLPARYRDVADGSARRGSLSHDEELFEAEEGEDLVGFDSDIRDVDRRRQQMRLEVGNMAEARRYSAGSGPPT